MKSFVKRAANALGYSIQRRDELLESIPADYQVSPYLPRVDRGALHRDLYFSDQLQAVRNVDGDIVECGVSIGLGALLFLLRSDYLGRPRDYWGFDSFVGFPEPVEKDEMTPIPGRGFWASPPEVVYRVLRGGRVGEGVIDRRVHLVKGLFDKTLPTYGGRVALSIWTATCISRTRSPWQRFTIRSRQGDSSCSTSTGTLVGRGRPRPSTNSLPADPSASRLVRSATGSTLRGRADSCSRASPLRLGAEGCMRLVREF